MNKESRQVKSRNEKFAKRVPTRIWQEQAIDDNPYIAGTTRCHGYDILDLTARCDFVDVLYLLFRGELPSSEASKLFETLMIALINPGPRHPATRAAMDAGVGKTDTVHILPIALAIMGGDHLGAGELEPAMRFIRARLRDDPAQVASEMLRQSVPPEEAGDWHIVPGFGRRFGGIDEVPQKMAEQLAGQPGSGSGLKWCSAFVEALEPAGMGWLTPGIAGAVFVDLGFNPRAGAGLFQLLSAPGLLAHGLELANKPVTTMPFVDDQHYIIENG